MSPNLQFAQNPAAQAPSVGSQNPGQGASPAAGGGGPGSAASAGQLTLPHGVRGAVAPYPGWVLLLALVLMLALLAGLLTAAWRWARRRRQNRPAKSVNPWDELLARCSQLSPGQPFTKETQEDFFASLSLLLREAIERRTALPATDRTYQELRLPLRDEALVPKELGEALLAFLERADLVKFAAAPSDDSEARRAAAQVSHWISALRPATEGKDAPS